MILDVTPVAPLDTNCYLVGDETSGLCALVDPGGSPQQLLEMIRRSGLTPALILLTHGHYDHVRAIPALLEIYPQLPVYIHPADVYLPEELRDDYLMPYKGENQHLYNDGDSLTMGALTFRVLHTPGHTAGSVVLLVEDVLLAGDTLFADTCGRWDLAGGSREAMLSSLARLYRLEGDYRVLSGHGGPTTLEQERKTNRCMMRAVGI